MADSVKCSGKELKHIPDSVLEPLRYMVRVDRRAAGSGVYGPLMPRLEIFLSHNQLQAVPSAIFSLQNLTVLSLRGNNLTSVPPAIGRLKRL